MNAQEIFELIDRFERSSLSELKLKTGDFALKLARASAGSAGLGARPADTEGPAAREIPGAARFADAAGVSGETAEKEGHYITAPVVGTYYAASSPGQAPFVVAGDRVFAGQTVCLLEAMKMISEVPAPCDCVIEEILKADGDLAAFGDALFRYRPC